MEAAPPTAAISTRGLTKHYGAVRALVDLDLEVRKGEIFGFLGPNGAGKSTAIRTLLGFLLPTRGTAQVLGLDIINESVEIRRRTGYLPGGIALYDSLSGEEVLDYLVDLQGREPHRRAELCERLELPASVLKRRVRDYSRGMRQKIGVVQALQHDPGVAIIRAGRLMALHTVSDLLARRRRRVTIRWAGDAPDLSALPGLEDVQVDGNRVIGMLSGEVAGFVRAIASPNLEDLTIEPASLEEAFLEYYASEGTPT